MAADQRSDSPAGTPAPSLAPVREHERIVGLDVLRGFALFGVLMVNLPFMGGNTLAALEPVGGLGAPVSEQVAWGAVKTLFESKFVALFSLLFGVGLVLQMQRAEAAGRSLARTYLARLGVLFLMGLLHGTLLYLGDILLPYAVLGLPLFLFRKLSPRVLLGISVGLLLLAGLEAGSFTLLEPHLADRGQETSRIAEIDSVESMLGVYLTGTEDDQAWVETVVNRGGPMSMTIALRALGYVMWLLLSSLIGFNTRVLGILFLGAAAMKWGLFRGDRRPVWRRLIVVGLVVGLPIELLGTGLHVAAGYESTTPQALVVAVGSVTSVSLSGAYAGAVLLFAAGDVLAPLRRGLAAVGRMSLSNYLSQSILANLIFNSIGLALYDELTRPQEMLVVCGIFLFQMIASVAWLRSFRMGPFEWIWRSLSYGKLQPLLRRAG